MRVGSGEPPEADRGVDLPATTIVPGFIDTHVHLTGTGLHNAAPELSDARSAAELLSALRIAAQRSSGPTMLHGFDESRWTDPTLPTAGELDAVSEHAVLAIRIDGHISLANRAAIEQAGAMDEVGLERDAEGAPTGVITRTANDHVRRWFMQHLTEHQIQELQLEGAALAASRGVTAIHEMSMPKERGLRDLQVLLGHRGRLPVDVVTYVATTDIPQAVDLGLPRVGGDLPVDGSIGARTAWIAGTYVGSDGHGAGNYSDDELAEFFHNGHLAGLQVGVHAIGDEAIDQVLRTWERIYHALDSRERRHFRARRHRVEHFEMVTPGHVERAAMLGLAVSVQPAFDAEWGSPGGMYETRLGWDRASGMNPFRTLVERGLEVGVGSDTPITPLDPMLAIDALERHHDEGQRLSRMEAIRLHTVGSARLAHQEDKKGRLEPGFHADFAAFETDPMTAESVLGLRPILTVSNGREVFAT